MRGAPLPDSSRDRAGTVRRGVGQPLVESLPWLWALSLAASYFALDPSASFDAFPMALSLALSLGFWCLFFAAGRWLYRRSPWTLLLTAPVLLLCVALAGFQQAHHSLFGRYVDHDRFLLIQLNWDTVVQELARSVSALPLPLASGLVLGALLPFGLYVAASRQAPFTPLRGSGGIRALAALLWLCWWASEFGFHALGSSHTPDLAGQVFANEIRESLGKPSEASQARAIPWTVERAGTSRVPTPGGVPGGARAGVVPNLVVVLLESVRADHLPSYGYPRDTMPFVEQLASDPETLQVEYAYGNASTSYFSMLALLSGLDLSRDYRAFASAPLVWDHLAARGYQTFVVTQSLGYPRYQLDEYMQTPGLDSYLDVGQAHGSAVRLAGDSDSFLAELRRRIAGRFAEALGVERDDALSLAAFQERILARDPARPFFGLWELECTHYPYCYPEAFRRFEPAKAYLHSDDPLTSLRNDYDNALLHSDHLIRRLIGFLGAEGLSRDTVVVITSDHGESFFERGVLFHGGPPYVEQARVPLLLVVPAAVRTALDAKALDALASNRRVPVQSIDLLPTLVDLADRGRGRADPPGDGESLLRRIDPDRELRVTNHPPFRQTRRRRWEEATVSRRAGYVIVYGDGRPAERYGLDGQPASGE